MFRLSLLVSLVAGLLVPLSAVNAQTQSCESYRVEARLLNMRSEPNVFGTIVDVLRQNQIVCLSESKSSAGQEWGLVVSKAGADGSQLEATEGWTSKRYLSKIQQVADTPSQSDPSARTPSPANGDAGSAAPSADVAVATFRDPQPYGPFPVRGRSLEQLANGLPLFAPIKGLPETSWKRKCTECHQWNKDRLCQQGKSYAENPAPILRIQHPYGGPYKKALGDWARAGCQ